MCFTSLLKINSSEKKLIQLVKTLPYHKKEIILPYPSFIVMIIILCLYNPSTVLVSHAKLQEFNCNTLTDKTLRTSESFATFRMAEIW